MLELNNVSKVFMRGNEKILAVNNFSLKINENEFVAITGRSGCGKTTILNMVSGFLAPTQGSIMFDGLSVTNMNDKEASIYRSSSIGYLPQHIELLNNLSVFDNIRFPFYLRDTKPSFDFSLNAEDILNKLGISKLKNAMPYNLSGGEKKRALLARALVTKPKMLLLDEPTSDLDKATAKEVMNILYGLENIAILCVTHDVDLLGDDVKVMDLTSQEV